MKEFLGNILDYLDPGQKAPWRWQYGWKSLGFIALISYLMYQWIIGPKSSPIAGFLYFFAIGVHEAGHPIFRAIFLGNFFMTIIGGTAMELGVPLLAFFWCLKNRHEIQADLCLLWLAIVFYSIGHYAGCSLDPVITLLNAGPETLPDWDYMHKWFGTEGYEYYIRYGCYRVSAFLTGLGTYLFFLHVKQWNNPDGHNYTQDDDGYRFFMHK